MRRSSFFCPAIATLIVVASTTASPVSSFGSFPSPHQIDNDRSLKERQLVDCKDIRAAPDSSCWGTLGLSQYLNDPNTGWNHTTPICDATTTSGACCIPGEPWTTCYLRLAHGIGGYDCSNINPQSCALNLQQSVDPSIAPQVHYVMKTIYSINNFFTTYWMALRWTVSQASTKIWSLINELDPKHSSEFNLMNLLSLLSLGLAFLGAPSIAVGLLAFETTTKFASQAIIIGVQQAPSFTKALWPSGTEDSKTIQVGQLNDLLGNATAQMTEMINNALVLLMSDMPTFVAFAESGRFSGSESLSLPEKTAGLDYGLTTYMLSEAMAKNGWFIGLFLNYFGPVKGEDVPRLFGCKYSDNNVCTVPGMTVFWSKDTGRVYLLTKQRSDGKTPLQVTQDIVAQGWASLEVLFDGAYNCTAEGKAGSAAINFNWDGTLDISCVSQVPVNIGCGAPCPVAWVNGACPFGVNPIAKGDCKRPNNPP